MALSDGYKIALKGLKAQSSVITHGLSQEVDRQRLVDAQRLECMY